MPYCHEKDERTVLGLSRCCFELKLALTLQVPDDKGGFTNSLKRCCGFAFFESASDLDAKPEAKHQSHMQVQMTGLHLRSARKLTSFERRKRRPSSGYAPSR